MPWRPASRAPPRPTMARDPTPASAPSTRHTTARTLSSATTNRKAGTSRRGGVLEPAGPVGLDLLLRASRARERSRDERHWLAGRCGVRRGAITLPSAPADRSGRLPRPPVAGSAPAPVVRRRTRQPGKPTVPAHAEDPRPLGQRSLRDQPERPDPEGLPQRRGADHHPLAGADESSSPNGPRPSRTESMWAATRVEPNGSPTREPPRHRRPHRRPRAPRAAVDVRRHRTHPDGDPARQAHGAGRFRGQYGPGRPGRGERAT